MFTVLSLQFYVYLGAVNVLKYSESIGKIFAFANSDYSMGRPNRIGHYSIRYSKIMNIRIPLLFASAVLPG